MKADPWNKYVNLGTIQYVSCFVAIRNTVITQSFAFTEIYMYLYLYLYFWLSKNKVKFIFYRTALIIFMSSKISMVCCCLVVMLNWWARNILNYQIILAISVLCLRWKEIYSQYGVGLNIEVQINQVIMKCTVDQNAIFST